MTASILLLTVVGHFALHLAIYNRVNATGLRRKTVKRISKLFLVSCIAVPVAAFLTIRGSIDWASLSLQSFETVSPFWLGYGAVCVLSTFFLGIPWLLWRPVLRLEWVNAGRTVKVVDVRAIVDEPLAISTKCRWQSRLPGNQIFELAVEAVDLPVQGLPAALAGMRIAHLSDIHLTGDISPAFTKHVVQESNRWEPDICVITGDVVDAQGCIEWLQPIFGPARAKLGKFFVLGNHDLRVPDSNQTRRILEACGWTDVGGKTTRLNVGDELIEIIGNEFPWFPAPKLEPIATSPSVPFRLLLSHSPDRIHWARRHGVKLMLAGHTHGGQGRLPLVGPLISPSWHGSRYASGDFYKAPTTMHVSRGLAGVHLIRIHCRPELSLLTLRPAPAGEDAPASAFSPRPNMT
ncbi:MAG: metallophosphoesterase [Planctomycetaceae bacterium]